jgi:hypothetical protein
VVIWTAMAKLSSLKTQSICAGGSLSGYRP